MSQKLAESAALDAALDAMTAQAYNVRLHAVAAAVLSAFAVDAQVTAVTFSVTQQELPTFPPSVLSRRVLYYSLFAETASADRTSVPLPAGLVSGWSVGEGQARVERQDPAVELAQSLLLRDQSDAALQVLARRLTEHFESVFYASEAIATHPEVVD